MLNFPFSRLPREMKVQVLWKLKVLSPSDAFKWMQINRELRALFLDHGVGAEFVDKIDYPGWTTDITIRTWPGTTDTDFDITEQAPFLSKIRFCQQIDWHVLTDMRQFRDPQKTVFSRILAAKDIYVTFDVLGADEFIEFLDCLKTVVTNSAWLQAHCEYCSIRFSRFIETSLKECSVIVLNFYDLPLNDVRMALSKTNVQMLIMINADWGRTITEEVFIPSIRDLLQDGIPSLHAKPLVLLQQDERDDYSVERVTGLFDNFPDIRELNGEDLEKARKLIFERFLTHDQRSRLVDPLCFLRSNENGPDVIYALQTKQYEMIFVATIA